MNEIEAYYDEQYDEWNRLEQHFVEFALTKRYLDDYLEMHMERTGKNSLKILDIGGGPGRYAIYLTQKGHRVTLLDLSQRNVEIAREKAALYGVTLEETIKGNALNLQDFDKDFDVVLLMGPLYHLVEEADRRKAMEQALDRLKPGGILIASFISAFAPLQECFAYMGEMDISTEENNYKRLLGYLKDGRNLPDEENEEEFTTAYFTGIEEARGLMEDYGLKELVFAGVESILAAKEKELRSLSKEEKKAWLDAAYQLSSNKYLLGTSMHFLYIGQKSAE